MRLAKTISEVIFFTSLNEQTFVFKNDGLYNSNDVKLIPYNSIWTIKKFKHYCVYQCINGGDIHVFDSFTLQQFTISGKYYLGFFTLGIDSFFVKIADGNFAEISADFKLIRTELDGKFPKYLLRNQNYLIQNGRLLKSDIESLTKIHEVCDFSTRFNDVGLNIRLLSDLIILDDKLFFHLSPVNQQGKTFCFDLNSNEIYFETKKIGPWFKSFDNKLICVALTKIYILNTLSFDIELIDLESQFSEFEIRMDNKLFTLKENYLFFVQNVGFHNARLGQIDIKSKEIFWFYNFHKDCGRIKKLESSDNILKVLTENNDLHFFESDRTQ